jgi:ABC-type nitrate/sulfonate/bicarbonate transport system ATPase subunit
VQRLIKELWKETQTTILFVTHNFREAVTLSTRVIALGCRNGSDNGAEILLDEAIPETADEQTVAGLIRRLEGDTFLESTL